MVRTEWHCARQNRAAQRLVNAGVHNLLAGAPPTASQAFAYPVVNDDGVVNRITGDGQHCANHSKSELAAEKRKHADRHKYIVQQRDDRAYGEGKFEAERYEN